MRSSLSTISAATVSVCLMALSALGQSGAPIAIVDGVSLSEADVRATAAEDLERLERRRLRFEADSRAEEHGIVEEALKGMIANRVLALEAERRGIPVDELLNTEVAAKAPVASEDEVRNVYDLNREQLSNVSPEVGLGRVRDFLAQRNYDQTLEDYVQGLRDVYGVESYWGPYRVEVAVEGHPSVGPEEAPVTLVEFSDFECPFCRRTEPVLKRIREEYGEQVRVVYRQFPLNELHPRAQKAAEASLCADQQGHFWEMHDALFLDPIELEVASLREKAASVGLDTAVFNECLDSARFADRIEGDILDGVTAGVSGTPTVFINGRPVDGAQPFEAYAAIIDDELSILADE